MRGVSETRGYSDVAYCVYGIFALGAAGTHSQLCIGDDKYRYAAGKKDFFNWLAHKACPNIFGGLHSHIVIRYQKNYYCNTC